MYTVRCEACDVMLHETDMQGGLCPPCKAAVTALLDDLNEEDFILHPDIELDAIEKLSAAEVDSAEVEEVL